MKRFGAILTILTAMLPPALAQAGSGNDLSIQQIRSLTYVSFVDVIDVAGEVNPHIDSMRAMPTSTPLTALQRAILENPHLMQAIEAQHWSPFHLRSVYAARVEGARVYIYLGSPPWN